MAAFFFHHQGLSPRHDKGRFRLNSQLNYLPARMQPASMNGGGGGKGRRVLRIKKGLHLEAGVTHFSLEVG
jgi:hypothetical protein